ncbi:MAG: RNA methyltransferase [Candidatus Doudnabacteria bacterium CG10_big_fil_rev_8_21_14_0_10_42_18]|uniref:RNA methyltransferase n=1 Tax=Candidatus Doudnabacteria bacterium CG10_big_fil_rev_8_21_14_0_10_42_18 TaxID=1974552 RepID=A0A2H0VBN4_9BACT|nr:MAG: RNA methyltransferase [Candidatus Doudnabacteria bacterium CG10_big_fil_rev_8_21_14_0_10_42_18]
MPIHRPINGQATKPKKSFYVIAHNIRSLHNVGSIFRTADAFGIEKIFLTGYTPTPKLEKHRLKINKVALGAEKFVEWEYQKSAARLIKKLQKKKTAILALENNASSAIDISSGQARTIFKNDRVALVLGEERKGINKKLLALCDMIVEIPMKGEKESLNVSVAFGVAAYEISKWLN